MDVTRRNKTINQYNYNIIINSSETNTFVNWYTSVYVLNVL